MKIDNLTLFDHLRQDVVVTTLTHILNDINMKDHYYELIRHLLERQQSLSAYIVTEMLKGDSKKLIKYESDKSISQFDMSCLAHDLEIFSKLFSLNADAICEKVGDEGKLLLKLEESHEEMEASFINDYISLFKSKEESSQKVQTFLNLLGRTGVSPFALYPAFTVKETMDSVEFVGFKDIHAIKWEHIYFYERQKEALLKNTVNFIEGKSYQNVLLVGASGTGKSTSVKALVNLYKDQKLRLIQLQKGQLHQLPKVLDYVEQRAYKFILFIDDLSFEANEDEYKFLKSFIEGSVSGDMSHVAFYVTSNRRHLIKEVRSERENDIHLQDFIQEMTSLSDRFGLTLLYEGLSQKEYFNMVIKMYHEKKVVDAIEESDLRDQARIYALRHGKMSGRVAMQFIKHLGL